MNGYRAVTVCNGHHHRYAYETFKMQSTDITCLLQWMIHVKTWWYDSNITRKAGNNDI